jgi:alkyldihydroxyacetonephosphate synthase
MDVVAALIDALGASVSVDQATRSAHRHDTWVRRLEQERQGNALPAPLAVVSPSSTAEARTALQICNDHATPVVPYGGGSGVVGGVQSRADAVVVSSSGLSGLRELHREDLLATFGAGTNGWEAEQMLQAEGLTTGHWPQSIKLSTVGGWVATRASGQFSTAYGNIEDIVFSVEAVTATGSVIRTAETPRAASGPDLRHVIMGNEGTLCFVTEVTLSIRHLPEAQVGATYLFDDFNDGLRAMRAFVQAGYLPPVVRLYDGIESKRNFRALEPAGRSVLLLVHEGPTAITDREVEAVAAVCASFGGQPSGSNEAEAWLGHKSEPPSAVPFLEKRIMVDTIEIAAPWSKVAQLYTDITERLRAIDGVLVASGHSSHSYRSGTNLYMTFATQPADDDLVSAYDRCWKATMDATISLGAGISHHHGIGRVRMPWMQQELGDGGTEALWAIKDALDPNGIMNPGVLLPER